MTPAAHLRAQMPASTDPARLEREARRVEGGWRPITTSPVGEDVLLFCPHSAPPVWIGHRFFLADTDWYPQEESTFGGRPSDMAPSHWMPLPEGPK